MVFYEDYAEPQIRARSRAIARRDPYSFKINRFQVKYWTHTRVDENTELLEGT